MMYNTFAEVPTPELEYQLDILERLRDRGDFADLGAYDFFFAGGVPLLADAFGGTGEPWDEEVLAVSEELMGRTDR